MQYDPIHFSRDISFGAQPDWNINPYSPTSGDLGRVNTQASEHKNRCGLTLN